MENHKTADKVCCSKKIMSQLPGFKQDVSLLVLANLCKTFWCHCPQVWSGLSLHFVFPMLAANIWRVHLTVLSICTSRPQACSSGHTPPGAVTSSAHWSMRGKGECGTDLKRLYILGSHQPTCERNTEPTYGLSPWGMQDQWEVLLRDCATEFESWT